LNEEVHKNEAEKAKIAKKKAAAKAKALAE